MFESRPATGSILSRAGAHGKSKLRSAVEAMQAGEMITVPRRGENAVKFEALNSIRKRVGPRSGLKYSILVEGDNFVITAYEPKPEQVVPRRPMSAIEKLRPIIRQIVREEFGHLF